MNSIYTNDVDYQNRDAHQETDCFYNIKLKGEGR